MNWRNLYGKPGNIVNDTRMLNELKNFVHQVCTRITILVQKGNSYSEIVYCSTTSIHIKDMTDNEIQAWIDTG